MTMTSRPPNALHDNSICYDSFLDLLTTLDPDEAPGAILQGLEVLAEHSYHCHPGRFTDGRFEDVALGIGRSLERHAAHSAHAHTFRPERLVKSRSFHVLHVIASVFHVGGPSRLIRNWVAMDVGTQHSLFITRQEHLSQVRSWLVDAIEESGGHVIILPSGASLLQKAVWLRQTLQSSIDLVILHTGIDLVPLVAMATTSGPPVGMINHADHVFWVGSSIADAVIDLRSVGSTLTGLRRSTPLNLLLPIPLTDVPPIDCHSLGRTRIGVPEDQVVLVTVGRTEKYLPYEDRNFVRTGLRILEDNPQAHLYVVGVSADFAEARLGNPRHERLHFMGYVEDPSAYQHAADVYLESFPCGSQTALLEAALASVPFVRGYGPTIELLIANDAAINNLVPVPSTDEEYIAQASRLIREPKTRAALGRDLRESMVSLHTGTGWLEQLHSVYDVLGKLQHAPRSIPAMHALGDSTDIALSSWQESQHPRSWGPLDGFVKYTRSCDLPSCAASHEANYPMALARMFEALQRHDFRTSREASVELFAVSKSLMDSYLQDIDLAERQNILCQLQRGIAARLKWARWKREWNTYDRLRKYVRETWPRREQIPELASERALPRFCYWLSDAWSRLRAKR